MRIRVRLALYAAAVIGAGMVVFGVLLGILVGLSAPEDQAKELAARAEVAADQLTVSEIDDFSPSVPLIPVDVADSTEQFVTVITDDGATLQATGYLGGAPLAIPAEVVVEARETGTSKATIRPADGVELRLAARSWRQPFLNLNGVVVVGQSTEFVNEQVAGFKAVIFVAGIITLLGSAIAAWLVAGRALRPLRELAKTTDEIGRTGDLTRRLPPVRARDDVGALTTSFNGMLDNLQSSRDRLAESLAAQRRFVADASHELRSPLTTVRNNAGFLIERPDADPHDREEAIADIGAEADRMTRLVDDLLFLAQADAGREARYEPVNLATILEDAARRAQRHAQPVLDVPAPVVVFGDPDALGRLIWILVDNAIKHGGGSIGLGLEVGPATASVHVADEGPGIPVDQLPLLFERFHRADPARSPAGSGLGLAIAREIAKAHGARLTVANRAVGGAMFAVEFPLPAPPG